MGLWNRLVSSFEGQNSPRSGKRLERTRKGRTASAIAGMAGKLGVDGLEERKLLAYTITPNDVDPATGLGTIPIQFAYVAPYLVSPATITAQQTQAVGEDLNDEQITPPNGSPVIPNGGNGRILAGSNIRVTSLADAGDPVGYLRLVQAAAADIQMRVAPFPVLRGYSFTFPDQQNNAARAVTNFDMQVITAAGSAQGWNPAGTEVRLLYRGAITRTLTGNALEAAKIANAGSGAGLYRFVGTAAKPIFDEVQVISTGANIVYNVDNLSFTPAATTYAAFIDSRVKGVFGRLTGPVGASVEFFDLYGRPEQGTLQLKIPPNGTQPLVGGAAFGMVDFNDGIGRIEVSGSDARTSLVLMGGDVGYSQQAPTVFAGSERDSRDRTYTWYITPPGSWSGFVDGFQQFGFGYDQEPVPNGRVTGLTGGVGSFLLGSPFVRDNTSVNTYGAAGRAVAIPVVSGFTRADQGLVINGSIGAVSIDAVTFGSSRIKGFVDQLNISQLLGSLTVDGDAGAIIIGGDAGRWSLDEGAQASSGVVEAKTGGQIIVGRTLGQLSIAGRNALDITVVGDVNSPATRPPRDIQTHVESEYIQGLDPGATTVGQAFIRQTVDARTAAYNPADNLLASPRIKPFYGVGTIRNDQVLSAEWIGNAGTSVRVKGDLSGRDPVDSEDTNDMYAFASDGSTPITIEGVSNNAARTMLIRIMDENGRTLAANQFSPVDQVNSRLVYKPESAGVYYINVSDPQGGDSGFNTVGYTMLVSGMLSETVGMITIGGLNGGTTTANPVTTFRNTINVLSGSVGGIRIGTGFVAGGGFGSVNSFLNYRDKPDPAIRDAEDDLYDVRGSTYSIPGDLHEFIAGSDIWSNAGSQATAVQLLVGGNLGYLATGQNPLAGAVGPNEGDVNYLNLRVGGKIGNVNIRGGIGMDQDNKPDPRGVVAPDPARNADVVIQTGVNGGAGDIGMFRTGFHLVSGALSITTSPGSTIGGLLFSQDVYTEAGARTGLYNYDFLTGNRGIYLNTGAGSDIRFVDFPRISMTAGGDVFTPIQAGVPLQFVDDSGAVLSITVVNPDGVNDNGVVGQVRSLTVNGGQGSVIGQISANLTGGRRLIVQGTGQNSGQGSIALGRVLITGADTTSSVAFTGSTEIDVYRLDSAGALTSVSNDTPGGDIVLVDSNGLGSITVSHGDLGTTQTPAFGPQNLGTIFGISLGTAGTNGIGGPITVPKAPFYNSINASASIYRPAQDDEIYGANGAYAEDLGIPVHDQVRGVVVRTGGLASVSVSGRIYDVYVTAGSIGTVVANTDATGGQVNNGRFEGIHGVIYAVGDIGSVDPGDGILPNGDSPVGNTGVVATDDIGQINLTRLKGAILSGNIVALNDNSAADGGDPLNGIASIVVTDGIVRDASITSDNIDSFWHSATDRDGITHVGTISQITLTNTNLFRSTVSALNIGTININNGSFDASRLLAGNDVGTLTAAGFKNSTLLGDSNEVRYNEIIAGHNIDKILAGAAGGAQSGIGSAPSLDSASGSIADLVVEAGGSITGGIAAKDISRSTFSVAISLPSFAASGSIRASRLNAGSVNVISATQDIVSSELNVAGSADSITTGGQISNSIISITGPSGRLNTLRAGTNFDGELTVTGSVNSITAGGNIKLNLKTSTSSGTVNLIQAGGDANVSGDIGGNLLQLTAGRNFGSFAAPGSLVVRGDVLGAVTATNGVLYNELRVGGAIRGTITSGGRISGKPTANLTPTGSIVASGTINAVVINSDFGGDIISYSGGITSITVNNGSLVGGRTIAAYDGSIGALTISNGHLLSNVHADLDIRNLTVGNTADGIFGSVGVDENRSAVAVYDTFRNQLPQGYFPTTALQGVLIDAGRDVLNVTVAGNFFESGISAGQRIVNVSIAGKVTNDSITTATGSFFVAGDSVDGLRIGGAASNAIILAGATSLGLDGRPGGLSTKADTLKPGNITSVAIGGTATNLTFAAGVSVGADGVYGTSDDKVVNGLSNIRGITVGGVTSNVKIWGDTIDPVLAADARFQIGGLGFQNQNTLVDSGVGTPGIALGAGTVSGVLTFNFTGPGQAYYNAGLQKVVLRNTTTASQLTISSSTTIPALTIVTNDDASLGLLRFASDVSAAGTVYIDGDLTALQAGLFNGNVTVGGNLGGVATGNFRSGSITAQTVGDITITGDFGNANKDVTGEVRIQALSAGIIRVTGGTRGLISIDRDAVSFTSVGPVEKSLIRFGGSVGPITAPSISESFVAAGNDIGAVAVAGDVFDTSIVAGFDLGTDANFGGTGTAADTLSAGTIATVTIGGNFRQSDLIAGLSRGADGYFGTNDDVVAAGRSSIGAVTITGTQVGSSRNSETYRVAASGPVSAVRVGNQLFTRSGNFSVDSAALAPLAIQVTKLETSVNAQVYTTTMAFNQAMDASSLAAAISVSEVRGTGDVEIRLVYGVDYTLNYNTTDNSVAIVFSRAITERNLPILTGQPGPGVYRFKINPTLIRAREDRAKLDGNGDGLTKLNETYSQDDFVGDAGDKLTAQVVTTTATQHRVDFYAADNLNIVMDNNYTPDGLPDTNTPFVIRGSIGDHPDNDSNDFRFAGDTDVYSITLKAGQIFHISRPDGSAREAAIGLFNSALVQLDNNGTTAAGDALPVQYTNRTDFTSEQTYLIKTTGTYYIIVAASTAQFANVNTAAVSNPNPVPGATGDYHFTVQIFDDGDTGFTSNVDSANGNNIRNAPLPIEFAGPDLNFATTIDNVSSIVVDGYVFTLNIGADGIPNTSDDVVTGSKDSGQGGTIVSTRTGDGVQTAVVSSAIGEVGHRGLPSDTIAADADVYHLNNRLPIAPGTRMQITVKMAETGADFGSRLLGHDNINSDFSDYRAQVQFALFDTSASTGISDAKLVFSPSDFKSFAGTPNKVIATDGSTTYGYDSNGDFYISFLTPSRQGASAGTAGTFAVYLQGAFNSDYRLVVVTQPTTESLPTAKTQNFLIETQGGSVNWLEAGGVSTQLGALDFGAMGITGSLPGGQNAANYLLTQTLAALNSLYTTAGFSVRFSTNPADFEFQNFSTIYLTNSADPLNNVLATYSSALFGTRSRAQSLFTSAQNSSLNSVQPYGYAQHVDALNADVSDEAVVFLPSFSLLSYNSSQASVDSFVQSLTAAIGRRAGDLMGMKGTATNATGTTTFDPFADNAVSDVPGTGRLYTLQNVSRALSSQFDENTRTDFYLGSVNAVTLLDRYMARN